MKLIIAGKEAVIGEKYQTFRGETVTLRKIQEPNHPGSTGRVAVQEEDGQWREFFPGVIGGEWEV